MLSSNEVYYTDESAQGKNFFKNFSDLVIGDVLKRLVIQERPQRLINQTPRVVFLGRVSIVLSTACFAPFRHDASGRLAPPLGFLFG